MTDKQALAKARRLLGPTAWVEKRRAGLNREEREAAHAELRAQVAAKPSGDDPAAYRAWRRRRDELIAMAHRQRYIVGTGNAVPGFGMIQRVVGGGDDWEEALADAAARK